MPKRSPGSRTANDINRQFGSRLRQFREMTGRSQTEIGHALHVSFQQIQKYENGTTSISLDRLAELAVVFSIPVPRLVDVTEHYTSGVAENDQSPYGAETDSSPPVGPLSREAVALVKAFNSVRSRKLRRAILTLVEGYAKTDGADRDAADDAPET